MKIEKDPIQEFKTALGVVNQFAPGKNPELYIEFLKVLELRYLNDRLKAMHDSLDKLVDNR